MKTILMAAAAVFALSTTAYAADWTFVGSTEYAVKADTLIGEVGAEYAVDRFTFTPSIEFNYRDLSSDEINSLNLNVAYQLTDEVNLYTKLEVNRNFEQQELTFGFNVRY